jgi:predicted Zn-dependent protease
MLRLHLFVFSYLLFSLPMGCTTRTVPITGRQQLNMASDDAMNLTAARYYSETVRTKGVSTNARDNRMVRDVGEKIRKAVELYYQETGRSSELRRFRWQYTVVKDPAVNASCLPGGRIVFNSGIMPVCQSEPGVATIMGHEVAHAIAKHLNERQSHAMMADAGLIFVAGATQNKKYGQEINDLTRLAVQLGMMLPHNRRQESEADHIGLILMAMAGYDPYEAVHFWERMKSHSGGGAGIPWLQTHPLESARIQRLELLIPHMLPIYKKALLEGK